MLLLGNQYGVGWVIQLIDDTEILLSCFSKKKKKKDTTGLSFTFYGFTFTRTVWIGTSSAVCGLCVGVLVMLVY